MYGFYGVLFISLCWIATDLDDNCGQNDGNIIGLATCLYIKNSKIIRLQYGYTSTILSLTGRMNVVSTCANREGRQEFTVERQRTRHQRNRIGRHLQFDRIPFAFALYMQNITRATD